MLDRDLAGLYQVETRVFVQAVQRNLDRFPDDFMFRLTKEEAERVNSLRSQAVISNDDEPDTDDNLRSQFVISNPVAAARGTFHTPSLSKASPCSPASSAASAPCK